MFKEKLLFFQELETTLQGAVLRNTKVRLFLKSIYGSTKLKELFRI